MDDTLYADGAAVVVFIDMKSQKTDAHSRRDPLITAVEPLWQPSPERAARTELARFMKLAGKADFDDAAPLVGRAVAAISGSCCGASARCAASRACGA